ncbi:MAG TPA: carbohydrate ABC transporter permease [Lachnospiraceae bacterium]|nr:carbohydrate ABC transporter permease [Lachnospiraceae bacterium]
MTTVQKIEKYLAVFLKYLSLVVMTFIAVIPVVSCVITAMKPDEEYGATNVMTLPQNWLYFGNFTEAWKLADMPRAFMNTAIILVFVLFFSVMFGTMLAYILDRFKFPGNNLIRSLYLFAALIPNVAMQVSLYKMMYTAGLINSLPGYILITCGTDVISIYIFLQFFENLPVSLDESAIMDGANYFQIFFKILFPLLKPAIVTVIILKSVSTYNEYYNANLYLQNKTLYRTVSTSLYTFVGPLGNRYNLICAGLLITLLPMFIAFVLFQKQIYSGLTSGAVKG